MAPNLIVCLTGMPGAGKSTIANGLKSQGFDVVVMGNAVRSEADKRNLEHNRENLASLMVTLRASDGPAAIAHLVEPEIQNATSDTVIVDGVRSDDEIAFFETICTTKILSVHASKDTRFFTSCNHATMKLPMYFGTVILQTWEHIIVRAFVSVDIKYGK